MQDFRKLQVWEKSHQLTLRIYKITESFPTTEMYGLTNQMRRSSASIPTNIAEGCGRDYQGELARFIRIAIGSASELQYQLILAHDLEYISSTLFTELESATTEVKRMLTSFLRRVDKS